MCRRILICGQIFAALICAAPKRVTAVEPDLQHRAWTMGDNLPAERIFKIVQGPEGYLWLGSEGGLIRFDGSRPVRVSSAPEGAEDYLILGEPNGDLWLSRFEGKKSSLLRYRKGKFEEVKLPPLPGQSADLQATVLCLARDKAEALWIGFFFGGLMRLDRDGTARTFSSAEGLPANKAVTALFEDSRGELWAGTAGNGVFRFRNGRFAHVELAGADDVFAIAEDALGAIWVGTSKGVIVIRDGQAAALQSGASDPARHVVALLRDRNGAMWIGTEGHGLFRYRHGKLDRYGESMGLTNNVVRSILEDSEGNIWAGTRGGLDRFSPATFANLTTADGLPSNGFGPMLRDRAGDLWLAPLAGGLYRWQQGGIEDFGTALNGDKVSSMAERGAGGIWLGRRSGGISLLRDGKLQTWGAREGLAAGSVDCVWEDRRGDLWAGIRGHGIALISGGKVLNFGPAEGFPAVLLGLGFAETKGGDIWVSDGVAGLLRIRKRRAQAFGADAGLAKAAIQAVFVDSKDRLWVASSIGLSLLENDRFRTAGPAEGVSLGPVSEFYEDRYDGMWLAGAGGIFRLKISEMDAYFAGRASALHPVKFGRSDGLMGASAAKYAHPIIVETPEGLLYFSSSRGLAVANPSRLPRERPPPAVQIEQLKSDNTVFDIRRELRLPQGTRRLQFEYTGLSLSAPDQVRFRYRLHGFDKDWIPAGAARAAEYTNLKPGPYRFEVAAAVGSGEWNPSTASLGLSIEPSFFETSWFAAVCAAALGGTIWLAYLARMRKIKENFNLVLNERTRIAREVHDTLLQGFAGIAWQLDSVSKGLTGNPASSKLRLDSLLVQMDQCLADARRAISQMRTPEKPARSLGELIADAGARLTQGNGIDFQLTCGDAATGLDASREESLFSIAREAIANAVSHASPKKISVTLRRGESHFELTVGDDGAGFDVETARDAAGHWGLTGMRERAAQMKGTMAMESQPGSGTRIRVAVPLRTVDGLFGRKP